jgi:RHS repeat-associated protein
MWITTLKLAFEQLPGGNVKESFESGNLYYHTGQGYSVPFAYTGSGTTLAQANGRRDYTVTYDSGSTQYTVADTNGNKDIFDASGNIIKTLDRKGDELDYTRDGYGRLIEVEDPAHGYYITFDLDANGRISSVTDSAGRTVTYTYDSNYNLTEVTYPATTGFPSGTTLQYNYDCDHRMTSETDGNGNTYITNTYGDTGSVDEFKVISQTYQGHTATWNYHDSGDFVYRHQYGSEVSVAPPTFNETTYTDYKGYVTDYYSDSNRDITRMIVHTAGLHSGEPSTYETDYTYDSKFNKTGETDPNGNSLFWTYDSNNNVLRAGKSAPTGASVDSSKGTQVLSLVTTFTYESRFNQVASVTDPDGNVTTYDYGTASSDPEGNLLKITYPTTAAGTAQETFTYNGLGQALTHNTPDGVVSQNTYDNSTGRLMETIRDYGSGKLNATAHATYDSYGHLTSTEDANGNISTSLYNALDQVTEIDRPQGEIETKSYDADGKVIATKLLVSSGHWEEADNVYNAYEQLSGIKHYTDVSAYLETTYTYDADGNKITETDPLSHTITTAYDERNKPYLKTDPTGKTVKFDFDGNGHTTTMTDELGKISTYAYDGLDRCKQKTFPDSSYQTWIYDAKGNVTSYRTTAGYTIALTYDGRYRLLTQNYGSTITNTYDIMGRLITATEGGASLTYEYDDLGRNTSFTDQAGHTSTYTYDLNGNRLNTTYPTSIVVKRAYDSSNRPITIKDGADTTLIGLSYDLADRNIGITAANSTTIIYAYDLVNRITSVDNSFGGSVTRNYGYAYDSAGRVTSITEPRGTISVGYSDRDEVNSITEPTGSPFTDQSFVYDASYNRASWTHGSTTNAYTVNNLNEYSAIDSDTPTWNSDGGLASFSANTYTYDHLDRLVEVDNSMGKFLYSYDPLGRRVKKVIENPSSQVLDTYQYHYDADAVAVEYQPSTTWTYYGGAMRTDGTNKQWYYRDGQGSVSAVADNSGSILELYEYNTQGQTWIANASGTAIFSSAIGNDFMFGNYRFDEETGNYFCNARYYSPTLGRFISRDPLANAEFSQGSNLYAYCRNNFANATDSKGTTCDSDTSDSSDSDSASSNGLSQSETTTTDSNGNTTVTENITDSTNDISTTLTTTTNSDGTVTSSSESVTSGGTTTTTTTDGTTTTTAQTTSSSTTASTPTWAASAAAAIGISPGTVSSITGLVELAGSVVTGYGFYVLATTVAIAGGPFAVAAVLVVGAILVGVEVWGGFENLERGKEGLGPEFRWEDGDHYPFGDGPGPASGPGS